jgi:hypothetical protein
LAAALVLLASPAARGADEDFNLFISPSGEPFTAPIHAPYPIVTWFNGADANHDGKLDQAEFRADAQRFFDVLDRNKDGKISSLEVTYYEQRIVPEILAVNTSDAGGAIVRVAMQDSGDPDNPDATKQKLDGNQGAVPFSLFQEPEPVRAADRNLDGMITLKEWLDQADRHFAALDRNGDGMLTLDELPQTKIEHQTHAKRR